MKKVLVMFIWIISLGLVVGASYPSPFITDNTATVVGSGTPTSTPATSIASNLGSDVIFSPSITFTQAESDKKLFSEEEICKLMKGCWTGGCSPYGYRTEEKYCGFDRLFREKYKFDRFNILNQSKSGEFCDNSFECKSNFCLNSECIDTIKTIENDVIKINKSDLKELQNIIASAEEKMKEDYDEESSKTFFASLFSLFKNIFKI